MNITDGKRETDRHGMMTYDEHRRNEARRLYDRLRKRSYRNVGRLEWGEWDHKAYVEGVRDALNEVLDG